jgi:hypothetical protein
MPSDIRGPKPLGAARTLWLWIALAAALTLWLIFLLGTSEKKAPPPGLDAAGGNPPQGEVKAGQAFDRWRELRTPPRSTAPLPEDQRQSE